MGTSKFFHLAICCSFLLLLLVRSAPQTKDDLFRLLSRQTGVQRAAVSPREYGSQEGYGENWFEYVNGNLSSLVESTIVRLSDYHDGLLLIHAARKTDASDTLTFVRGGNQTFTVPLSTHLYNTLSAISHLPVSAVVALIPEVTSGDLDTATLSDSSRENLQQLQVVLEETSNLLQDEAFEDEAQSARQTRVTDLTMNFVSEVLSGDMAVTGATLQTFTQSLSSDLQANAKDAVGDYLTCLNSTIAGLLSSGSITEAELQTLRVAIPVDSLTRTQDFIVLHYQRLLGNSPDPRVFVLPVSQSQSPYSVNSSLAEGLQQYALPALVEYLIQAFSSSSRVLSSPHDFLSDAASEIVCTEVLQPLCNMTGSSDGENNERGESEELPPGFKTRAERIYVIVIIYTGTLATVLVIALSCICLEGRKMKLERRKDANIRKVPNVFSPVSQSDSQPTDSSEDGDHNVGSTERSVAESELQGLQENSLELDLSAGATATHSEVTLL